MNWEAVLPLFRDISFCWLLLPFLHFYALFIFTLLSLSVPGMLVMDWRVPKWRLVVFESQKNQWLMEKWKSFSTSSFALFWSWCLKYPRLCSSSLAHWFLVYMHKSICSGKQFFYVIYLKFLMWTSIFFYLIIYFLE